MYKNRQWAAGLGRQGTPPTLEHPHRRPARGSRRTYQLHSSSWRPPPAGQRVPQSWHHGERRASQRRPGAGCALSPAGGAGSTQVRPEKTSVRIKDKQGRRVWSGSNWKLQPPHSKPPNRLLSVSAKSTEMPLETGKTQMLMVATSWLWQLPSPPPPWSSQAWEGREGGSDETGRPRPQTQ